LLWLFFVGGIAVVIVIAVGRCLIVCVVVVGVVGVCL